MSYEEGYNETQKKFKEDIYISKLNLVEDYRLYKSNNEWVGKYNL